MNAWVLRRYGVAMTWRRWLLLVQTGVAFYLLSGLLLALIGIGPTLPTFSDSSAGLIAYGIVIAGLLAAMVAPIGIFKQRAWGYFLELPVLVLVFLACANVGDLRTERDLIFGVVGLYHYAFILIVALPEVWRCGRTGFRLMVGDWRRRRERRALRVGLGA